jgi:hypothetical protein
MHAADGVHLNDLGQLAMAFAILKGLGAPADVSTATIDFTTASVAHSEGCQVLDVKANADGGLDFTRLDEGLPINFGLFGALNFRFVPVPAELNRYLLAVRNLPTGKYRLTVDGRAVSQYTQSQLGKGVNIASATADAWQPGGPWDAQSTVLRSITEARSRLAAGELMWNTHLAGSPQLPAIAGDVKKIDAELEQLQRQVARPMPYHFQLSKIE